MVDVDYKFREVAGIPIAQEFDRKADGAGLDWARKVIQQLFILRRYSENYIEFLKESDSDFEFVEALPERTPAELIRMISSLDFGEMFAYYLPDLSYMTYGGRPNRIQDYLDILPKSHRLTAPKLYQQEDWDKLDRYFANQFVAGMNPVMLKRVIETRSTESHDCLTLSELTLKMPDLQNLVEDDDAGLMVREKRLFYVDYVENLTLSNGVHPYLNRPKYSYAPIVILGLKRGQKRLMPLAIQCGQDSSYKTFKPSDHYGWMIAKTIVQAADSSYHEMISHLAQTHLVIEACAVCTKRKLSPDHPVRKLLDPHFVGTMPINALAVTKLIQKDQAVDRLVGSSIESNYEYISQARLKFSFSEFALPERLKRHGLSFEEIDSSEIEYPYREDAILLWDSILQWTSDYVWFTYRGKGLLKDKELQNWLHDLKENGKLQGWSQSGDTEISSLEELSRLLCGIIFLAGPQHGAVNFAQSSNGSFMPSANLAGYQPAPRVYDSKKSYTENDWLSFLPPLDVAYRQYTAMTFLGNVKHSNLGQYPRNSLDKRVEPLLKDHQGHLLAISQLIQNRNQNRLYPYPHLDPQIVPMSINI